jgi:hypothetical protein
MFLPEYLCGRSMVATIPFIPAFAFLHDLSDTPVPTQKRWFRETFEHLSEIAKSAEAADAGVHLVSG